MHYKCLKKIIEALGYKIIDLNLKNERLLKKYSEYLSCKNFTNIYSKKRYSFRSISNIGAKMLAKDLISNQ